MLHDLVDIGTLAKIAGPLVIVGALIVGAINANGGPADDKGERFLHGALLGAIIGAVIAVVSAR